MYEQQGLQDYLYMMLYGAAALMAVLSCLYLLFRRANILSLTTEPPLTLRLWTAAFFGAVALSHVWWVVIGRVVLKDDLFLRNAVNIGLDSITLVPLMMAALIRMLQDRHRPLWPIGVAMIPVVVAVGIGIIWRFPVYEDFIRYYLIVLAVAFMIGMIIAVRQYGRWLHDNFADLWNKEVWQSMILLGVILLMFVGYKTNFGSTIAEYCTQLNTLLLIAFMLWRVETLQTLKAEADDSDVIEGNCVETSEESTSANADNGIGQLLKTYCEAPQLYLQQDLTREQLSAAIGTNRTYLSAYFQQQGITYNTYINRLRVEHFMRLYREATAAHIPFTIQKLAQQSGFQTYRNFGITFKKFMGMTASEWMERNTN